MDTCEPAVVRWARTPPAICLNASGVTKRGAFRRLFCELFLFCWLSRGLQPALDEQRVDDRVAAAEVAVERRRFLAAAAREDHVAEALTVLAGHPAVLLEPVVGVVVDQLAPHVGVVAGRVA